jgi:adenosylcobinamide-phosphate synthase
MASAMTLPTALATAAGLALGHLADCALGDPRRRHPVAAFGRLAAALEQRGYAGTRLAGVRHVGTLVGGAVLLGTLLEHHGRRHPAISTLTTAASTWLVLGSRSLLFEARTIANYLEADELHLARDRVRNLVGRQTAGLSSAEVARATVESVAENTSDAVVAPLFWGAVAGVPGLLGYRAANTLDAMIGHRSARYLRFGWAAARLDDLVNWIPARIAALLAAGLAPIVGGSVAAALETWRRDARQHPSPNAGVVEATFAGALGVQLGGRNVYHGEVEDRGLLGDGRTVQVADIARAARLSSAVSVGAVVLAAAGSLLRGARPA